MCPVWEPLYMFWEFIQVSSGKHSAVYISTRQTKPVCHTFYKHHIQTNGHDSSENTTPTWSHLNFFLKLIWFSFGHNKINRHPLKQLFKTNTASRNWNKTINNKQCQNNGLLKWIVSCNPHGILRIIGGETCKWPRQLRSIFNNQIDRTNLSKIRPSLVCTDVCSIVLGNWRVKTETTAGGRSRRGRLQVMVFHVAT